MCNDQVLTQTHLPNCDWQVSSLPHSSPRLTEVWCVMPALIPLEAMAQAWGLSSVVTVTMIW